MRAPFVLVHRVVLWQCQWPSWSFCF